MASALDPVPMVILTLLESTAKGGPPGLALETVNIQKVRVKILDNYVLPCTTPLHYVHHYFLYPLYNELRSNYALYRDTMLLSDPHSYVHDKKINFGTTNYSAWGH